MAVYDDTAAIGKLYRRQDEIGTPWCVTVDVDSLEDGAVTLRDRDTMAQERIPVEGIKRPPSWTACRPRAADRDRQRAQPSVICEAPGPTGSLPFGQYSSLWICSSGKPRPASVSSAARIMSGLPQI